MQRVQTRERQAVAPRAKRRTGGVRARRAGGAKFGKFIAQVITYRKPLMAAAAALGVLVAYQMVTATSLFALRQVEVNREASPALRAGIEQVVRNAVGDTRLMDVDLKGLRKEVEKLPRVREASVARMLPDGICVGVVERQPAVLVRRASGVVWLDEEGAEVGEARDFRQGDKGDVPPLATGFIEGSRSPSALAEDRKRIALYRQVQQELSQGAEPLWNRVDEVDLSATDDVSLRLVNPAIAVHVGGQDFRQRLEGALKIYYAAQRGDADLLGQLRVRDAERLIERADDINEIFTDGGFVVRFSSREAARPAGQASRAAAPQSARPQAARPGPAKPAAAQPAASKPKPPPAKKQDN